MARGQATAAAPSKSHGTHSDADSALQRGLSLANAGDLRGARRQLLAGESLAPKSPRFPEELAGIAYRQHRYRAARRDLMRALKLAPTDTYASDFLGTLFFLQGNLAGALKYWNRAGKPVLRNAYFRVPGLDPLLLDRAFRFSPGREWTLPEFRRTRAELAGLDLFPLMRFDLQPIASGQFDLKFSAIQRPSGFALNAQSVAGMLRGLPYLSAYSQFYNLNGRALNAKSFVRWDDQKRRLSAELAGPWASEPRQRARLYVDGRNENWNISRTILPGTAMPASFNLERIAAGAGYAAIPTWRWRWSAAAEYTWRHYRTVTGIPAAVLPLFVEAQALALRSTARYVVIRAPERRFGLDAGGWAELGNLYTGSLGRYAQAQGEMHATWLPQARGDDYEAQTTLRAGGTAGRVPLDDLFMLGFDRDNPLWMRGHNGLVDGRKGNAPLGRSFVLSNTDFDKMIFRFPLVGVRVGPFLDLGAISGISAYFGSKGWMTDTGVQASVRALGGFTYVLGYGRDLRSGANTFYTAVTGWPIRGTNLAAGLH